MDCTDYTFLSTVSFGVLKSSGADEIEPETPKKNKGADKSQPVVPLPHLGSGLEPLKLFATEMDRPSGDANSQENVKEKEQDGKEKRAEDKEFVPPPANAEKDLEEKELPAVVIEQADIHQEPILGKEKGEAKLRKIGTGIAAKLPKVSLFVYRISVLVILSLILGVLVFNSYLLINNKSRTESLVPKTEKTGKEVAKL